MSIQFSTTAWEDYQYWVQHDKQKLRRLNLLIQDTLRNHFTGLGKPEPLKLNLQGFWSRRIDEEHRLIYRFNDGQLIIVACRYHYS